MKTTTLLADQDQTNQTAVAANPSVQKSHLPAYRLPLETGTARLTLKTLNKHSTFKFPKHNLLEIKTRMLSYHNEILTIGISLLDQPEDFVYLTVKQNELQINCSTGTTETHLSRYAYFALHCLMSVYKEYNFEKYYWPGFFDAQTGESKYLVISKHNDRIEINLKPEYISFYKPGQEPLLPFISANKVSCATISIEKNIPLAASDQVTGYCLADTGLYSLHSNHFPFLISYLGTATKNKDSIKCFTTYLKTPQTTPAEGASALQLKLNQLCHQMAGHAEITIPEYNSSKKQQEEIAMKNLAHAEQLFALWQKALPSLQIQPFTHYLYSYGMNNITAKPRHKKMQPCTFSIELPQPCFYLSDKGKYYELEMKFKAGGKVFDPNPSSPAFFISDQTDPLNFYLLNSLSDYRLTAFFAHTGFKLSVLKCHYNRYIKWFTEQLAEIHGMQVKTNHPAA